MLTWAIAYLLRIGVELSGLFLLAAIAADVASFYYLAVIFTGWPK